MNAHRNARKTPYSRALIVQRPAAGEAAASIAAALGISIRTVYKWIRRTRPASPGDRCPNRVYRAKQSCQPR